MRKTGTTSRILRLTASSLAVVGLLGHGLAMLFVALLSQPSVAAQPGFAEFIEICRAGVIAQVPAAELGSDSLPPDSPHRPAGPNHGEIEGCPVCNAFAQIGTGDLPTTPVLSPPGRCSTQQRPLHDSATRASVRLAAQPRAPPARN